MRLLLNTVSVFSDYRCGFKTDVPSGVSGRDSASSRQCELWWPDRGMTYHWQQADQRHTLRETLIR